MFFIHTISFIVSGCEEGDIRLVDGISNTTGRVEMCLEDEWRAVGDDNWGEEEATVVCRQLGLPTDGQNLLSIIILKIHSIRLLTEVVLKILQMSVFHVPKMRQD